MPVKISDRIGTFGESDVYAAQDGNRGALGLHVVNSTSERNSIPIDRRKGTYEAAGVNATPKPMMVAVRTGATLTLYWLSNEPGTALTTDSDWEELVIGSEDPFQGFFIPASTTLVDGIGTKGHYWIASEAGSHDFDNGLITFAQYDKALYDGALWGKVGSSTAVADWDTMINTPSVFPPEVHTHIIGEVTGLQSSLDNKVEIDSIHNEINDEPTEIPTSHAVVEYTYSKSEVDTKVSNLSTYGIKYSWANATQMNAQTGQLLGDLGLRVDLQSVYKWSGTLWEFFFELASSGHIITNAINTVFPSRAKLKFVGANVIDDSLNDRTVVTIPSIPVDSVNGQVGVVVLDSDDIAEGTVNKWFTESKVLSTILTGFSTAMSTVVNSADSVLEGIGKLQAQVSNLVARIQNNMNYDGTGSKISTTDAVNNMVNNVAMIANATGFIRTDDSFSLYKYDDNTLGINASQYGVVFKQYFESASIAPVTAIKHLTARTVPLSTVAPLPTNSNTVLYVGWSMPSDTIVFSPTSYVQSKTICQLGIIFVKNVASVYSFTDTNRHTVTIPDVSAYNNLQTTAVGTISNIIAAHTTSGLTIKNTAGSVKGISINWGGSNTDERTVIANNPTTFTPINPGNANDIVLPSPTTTISPLQYWNGTVMTTLTANTNAQVMRVLVTNRGTFIVQPGETQYTNLDDAKDNALIQTFTNFIPKDTFVEIARIAVRKGATNLADNNDAVFYTGGGGGGGSTSTATFASISGSPYDNTSLSTELNNRAYTALLTGYTVGANTAVLATDTISAGIGKIEKKINDSVTTVSALVNGVQASFTCSPDFTMSDEVVILGKVTAVSSENRTAVDGSTPSSGNFVYQYRDSASSTFSANRTFAQIQSDLITSSTTRVFFVRAINTTNTVTTTSVFTISKT